VSGDALPAGGVWADTAEDGLEPEASSAALTTKTTVEVTLSEGVTGMTSVADWTVAGARPSAVTAGGQETSGSAPITISAAATTVTLTLASEQAADATPVVEYSQPSAPASRLADAAGNHLASTSTPHVTAADRVRPSIDSVGFGSTTIEIRFDEPITVSGSITVQRPGGTSNAGAGLLVDRTLQLGLGAIVDGTYSLNIPATAVVDRNGNQRANSAAMVVATRDTVAPTLSGIEFADADTIEATFSKAIADPSGVTFEIYDMATGGSQAALSTAASRGPASGAGANTVLTIDLDRMLGPGTYHADLDGVRGDSANVNAYDAAARDTVVYAPDLEPPMVSSLTVEVDDGPPPFTARTGDNSEYANEGDQITVSLTLNEDSGAPTIAVLSDTSERDDMTNAAIAVAMGTGSDSDDSTWYHSFTVARGDIQGALMFAIDAVDASGNEARITQAGVMGDNAIIDYTAPAPAAHFADPLTLVVSFGEEMASAGAIAGMSYQVTVVGEGGAAAVRQEGSPSYDGAAHALSLTLEEPAELGEAHTVVLPASGLADLAGNAAAPLTPSAAVPFEARTQGLTTTAVTFARSRQSPRSPARSPARRATRRGPATGLRQSRARS